MEYQFSKRAKLITYILMAIGIIALIVGYVTDHAPKDAVGKWQHMRFWASLYTNTLFFIGISIGALFFLALQYTAEVSWYVVIKRVLEAIMQFLPIGAAILIILFICSTLNWNNIYVWMDSQNYLPYMIEHGSHISYVSDAANGAIPNPHFDASIANKRGWLDQTWFWVRTILYLGSYIWFARFFRQTSLLEDRIGGTDLHFKMFRRGALFLVIFGIFSMTSSWDWFMSIDIHWHSTIYGWFVFSGMWINGLIMLLLLVVYLMKKGLLPDVNEEHLHNIGLWLFAVSFLWSYLWFEQFLLIWYTNIPEEVVYLQTRLDHFGWMQWSVFIVNFAVPMVILMSRDSKRKLIWLLPVTFILLIFHWLDYYLLIYPGTVKHMVFGFTEIGMFLGFLGLFLFVVLRALTKAPLMVKNHPFLDESKHVEI